MVWPGTTLLYCDSFHLRCNFLGNIFHYIISILYSFNPVNIIHKARPKYKNEVITFSSLLAMCHPLNNCTETATYAIHCDKSAVLFSLSRSRSYHCFRTRD